MSEENGKGLRYLTEKTNSPFPCSTRFAAGTEYHGQVPTEYRCLMQLACQDFLLNNYYVAITSRRWCTFPCPRYLVTPAKRFCSRETLEAHSIETREKFVTIQWFFFVQSSIPILFRDKPSESLPTVSITLTFHGKKWFWCGSKIRDNK